MSPDVEKLVTEAIAKQTIFMERIALAMEKIAELKKAVDQDQRSEFEKVFGSMFK